MLQTSSQSLPAIWAAAISFPGLHVSESSGSGNVPLVHGFQERRSGKKLGPRVLVVDDEEIIANTVADILNRNGFHAVAVYSAREAVRQARRSCPDIVLCDVVMPEMNGVDAAIAIQQACPNTRIVLFSGQAATSALLGRARAQGYDFDLLAKPIHPRELLRKLSSLQ